jgi:hypothetical protein
VKRLKEEGPPSWRKLAERERTARGSLRVRFWSVVDGKLNEQWGDDRRFNFERTGELIRVDENSSKLKKTIVLALNEDYSFRAVQNNGGSAFRLAGVISNRADGAKQVLTAIDRTLFFRAVQAWREVWPASLEEIFGSESTKIEAASEERVGADRLVKFTVQFNIPEYNLVCSNLSLTLWPDKSWVVREAKFPYRSGVSTIVAAYKELADGQVGLRKDSGTIRLSATTQANE